MLEGFVYAPYGDLEAAKAMVGAQTAAILVEPIQGEGGVNIPPEGFLQGLRELCDQHGALLIFDEVQTGVGRDRKSTRLNSSHANISYAVFCLKKKNKNIYSTTNIET